MFYKLNNHNIKGVDVFLERYQTRIYVGHLTRDDAGYIFTYSTHYLRLENIIPLGVEFPLTQQEFKSQQLFESFKDRLPDPDNPAYGDYCIAAGINIKTGDPLILLSTIAKRGPSSFIFEPFFDTTFTFEMYEQWRKELKFSMKDFADFFGVSLSILQKMKAKKSSGKEVLEHLKLFWLYEHNFKHQLYANGKWLHPKKIKCAEEWMKNRFKDVVMINLTKENQPFNDKNKDWTLLYSPLMPEQQNPEPQDSEFCRLIFRQEDLAWEIVRCYAQRKHLLKCQIYHLNDFKNSLMYTIAQNAYKLFCDDTDYKKKGLTVHYKYLAEHNDRPKIENLANPKILKSKILQNAGIDDKKFREIQNKLINYRNKNLAHDEDLAVYFYPITEDLAKLAYGLLSITEKIKAETLNMVIKKPSRSFNEKIDEYTQIFKDDMKKNLHIFQS